MSINSEHPFYFEFKEDWITMRDLYRGERVVKRKHEHYLPPTSGMRLDGMGSDSSGKPKPGQAAYNAYLRRAFFADYVKEGVEALIGMMHQKPATFELPDIMQPLVEKCTLTGEGLQELLRRVNTEQLTTGRLGLLADLPAKVDVLPGSAPAPTVPYIALYIAEAIINWDNADMQEGYNSLNMVVLNESGFYRLDNFTWKELTKYRILQLGDMLAEEDDGTAQYKMGTFTDKEGANNLVYDATVMQPPMYMGKVLDQIPFVFINTKDVNPLPDDPPLLGLGKLSLAIYRGDADYRQNLFMQGQDTLVIIGGIQKSDGTGLDDSPLRTGAGSVLYVEAGGDAKYIGVESEGLSEQRTSLENDRALASQKAGNLIQPGPSKQDESGEALKTRITAQTATLNQIALAGAKGLENLLKIMAEWMSLPQATIDKIKVTPNLEFADFALVAADIVQLVTAKSMGAPLSKESIHGILVERGITQMTFDDEMAQIEQEVADMPTTPAPLIPGQTPGGPGAPGNQNPPADPEDEPTPTK